jgi:hypothetical protein
LGFLASRLLLLRPLANVVLPLVQVIIRQRICAWSAWFPAPQRRDGNKTRDPNRDMVMRLLVRKAPSFEGQNISAGCIRLGDGNAFGRRP